MSYRKPLAGRVSGVRALTGLLALAAVASATAATAQSMVVRSTGPSATKFPIGKKFGPNERIILVAGDQLVLLDKGKTRTLARAGTHNASASVAANQTLSSTMTRMIAKEGAMRSRGGFTRGDGNAPPTTARAPNLWLIDMREGGNFCVADSARLLFWRPDLVGDAVLRIELGSDASSAQTLAFVDGQAYRRWPSDALPLRFDVGYRMTGVNPSAPVTINFHALETLPDAPDQIAELLMAKGCTGQLSRMVDAMAEEEAGAR